MDKTVLKNFAIYARNKLIHDTTTKASMLGITEKGIEDSLPESNHDMKVFDIGAIETFRIYGTEVAQYNRLVEELKERASNSDYKTAYDGLIEEVAYTWFNRLIAIRFMEVNGYMPDRMRILSSGREGVNEPEFVTNCFDTSLDFTEEERTKLEEWQADGSAEAMENMFHLLFIKQCNALNENLPELFEKTDDYSELLLTISYNDPDGVVYKLVHDIPEEYFDIESRDGNGQVEIIGWLYQYYNTELKDEVFARPKSLKIQKEDIAPATQLFTPDWIVRYMVENSLGRLWIEKLISSGDSRSEEEIAKEFGWEYYIPEAKQDAGVIDKLAKAREGRKALDLKLEEIRFIDPAMGSFHIGIYAFDIFMQLYESQGYTSREATKLIIEKNLYGLDIDKRAYQLSYFACMMKGRQYNRRILNQDAKCNLYAISESNKINRDHIDYLGDNISDKDIWQNQKEDILEILDTFIDAKEYGSILEVSKKDDLLGYDFLALEEFVLSDRFQAQITFESQRVRKTQKEILEILSVAKLLSEKYDIVVTNPPYMGSSGMNPKLKKHMRDNYPNSKADLFAVFMERCRKFTRKDGYYGMITQHAWMFLSSYEKLRGKIQSNTLMSMLHLGPRAFEEIGGEVVQATTFVFKNALIDNYKGSYIRLVDYNSAEEKEVKTVEAIQNPECGYYYEASQDNFAKIPGMPIAYWISSEMMKVFANGLNLKEIGDTRQGMATSDNNRFLRFWHEIENDKIGFSAGNAETAINMKKKWFPYNKGGQYKKWYGNMEYVINYENDGAEIKEYASRLYRNYTRTIKSISEYFKPCLSWSKVSSGDIAFRYYPEGFIFDVAGCCIFFKEKGYVKYVFAFLNSLVCRNILDIISPTLNYEAGHVAILPLIIDEKYLEDINKKVKKTVNINKLDWDSYETSWDFTVHPLAQYSKFINEYQDSLAEEGILVDRQDIYVASLEHAYKLWKDFTATQFDKLKANEEELNRIFIEIYGLEDELTPEVKDRDITITKIFDSKDDIYDEIKGNRYILTKEDVVKSFISYAVGCMFGRYSLDVEGLAYAGGEWDDSKYSSFIPAKDNVLLITDEEYFEDDIVGRFVEFVKVCYGEETLEENLAFIADALGGRGTPREIIRNYFVKNFYKDHVKTYKKRPIYWLYDSGRQNGFKALIYMHRYNEDTTGKVRIDYLHKMQRAYEWAIDFLNDDIAHNKNAREVAKSEKRLTKVTKQLKECRDYDEKISHLALARIGIDLDDGVKVNYEKVQTDEKGKKFKILANI